MPIQLGDDNTITVTYHELTDATQGYVINALCKPTFHLSPFSVNQLDLTPFTATFGGEKSFYTSPPSPISIAGHRINDPDFRSPNVASTHSASTSDGLPSNPSNIYSSTNFKSTST